MRNYDLTIYSPGHWPVPNTPKSCYSKTAKVGEVALDIFHRVFGRNPDRLFWHTKGFMAQAKDRRGNCVLVQQINHDHLPGFDVKSGTFPLMRLHY